MLLASYYPAHADSFPKGMKAYERNDFAEAQRLFLKSTNPEAWFWLASMYQDKNIDGCDLNCAASWYYKAADNGYLKAIPAAVMFWNAGDHDKAMRLFRYGARWNEPASIQFLQDQREVPPPSDLWLADQSVKGGLK
jgi:TPR repeat protein